MMTAWKLWDLWSGNAIGEFASEADALVMVRDIRADLGPAIEEPLQFWTLERHDGDTVTVIATGAALVTRALED